MAIVKLDSGRIVASQAEYLNITPYVNEDELGTTTYGLPNIVGDSLSFSPEENTTNAVESEFKDDPLFENTILGKYTFNADNIDFSAKLLAPIMGWEADGDDVYAPSAYKDIYALVEIGFRNEDMVLVAPKVKLNSRAIFESMKTGTGTVNLAGTAYSADITKGGKTRFKPLCMLKSTADTPAEYEVLGKTFVAGNDEEESGIQTA
jgi:hypothetical protein